DSPVNPPVPGGALAKKGAPRGSVAPLKPRIQRAISEGRFQQALDLAKQLSKQEPTPENRELHKTAALGRARQLREQGYSRDALATLEAATRLDPDNLSWLEQIARETAMAGGIAQALILAQRLPPDSAGLAALPAALA